MNLKSLLKLSRKNVIILFLLLYISLAFFYALTRLVNISAILDSLDFLKEPEQKIAYTQLPVTVSVIKNANKENALLVEVSRIYFPHYSDLFVDVFSPESDASALPVEFPQVIELSRLPDDDPKLNSYEIYSDKIQIKNINRIRKRLFYCTSRPDEKCITRF